MASIGEGEVESLKKYCKMISESLGPSVTQKLGSLIEDFDKQRISLRELLNSIPLFFDETGQEYEDDDTDLEEGEIREDRLPLRDEPAELNRLESLKSGADAQVRVSDERELEKHVTNGLDKISLEGKKRRILKPEPIESSPKKTRTSRRLHGVTPSYEFILEEKLCPAKHEVLNNEYRLKKFDEAWGLKKLTKYEEALARCKDDMYEANMLMEALKSAVEKAEKFIREEMSVEDLGVKFYRCIEMLYAEHFKDVIETVRQDHKKVLPVILRRFKQKRVELTDALENWKPIWKKVIKENTEKQRESTEQGRCRRKKVKESSKF